MNRKSRKLKLGKLIFLLSAFSCQLCFGQTHTMPGANVVPSGASLTINSGASITAAVGSTVTGFGGGAVSLTATTPIIVTPSPITGTGVISLDSTSKSNWDTAFSQVRQWDGGATGLVAATGRTSLALNNVTNNAQTQAAIVPNTAPAAGQLLVGNAGGTAYAPVTLSGSGATISLASTGVMTISGISGVTGISGTPATGQVAIWTNATTQKGDTGLTYTGTGTSALLDIGGTDLGLARNGAGVLEVNNGTAGQWGSLKAGVRDAGTATAVDVLTLGHQSSGTPTTNFGTGIMLNANDNTTAEVNAARIFTLWTNATHGSRTSRLTLQAANSVGLSSNGVHIFPTDGLNAGSSTDPGTSIVSAAGGFKVNAVTPTAGLFLISDGAAYKSSGYQLPTTTGTGGMIMQSNGTNAQWSTPTWPTAAGTAGYTLRSDGTNFASYPQDMFNSSVTSQATFSTSDIYIAGSNVVVAAGDFKAKGQYHCVFDMTKSAGTGAIVISVRAGTLGTTGDTAQLTFTFGAGTSIADTGVFDIWVTWRTVGSGTSAVMQGVCRAQKNAATTTGLWNNAGTDLVIVAATSSGFASNTFTNLGLSFNGSTAFAGTGTLVQATLVQ